MLWHQMGNKICSYPQFDVILFLSVLTQGNNNNNNNNRDQQDV
jgi:hypothetical protein